MMDWDKTRATFEMLFDDVDTSEMVNTVVPVAECDWHYTVTLESEDSLQIVFEGAGVQFHHDMTDRANSSAWLFFGSYEARQLAAILLGFADASDARKKRESR